MSRRPAALHCLPSLASLFSFLLVSAPLLAHGVTRFDNGLWWRDGSFQRGTLFAVDGVLALETERKVDAVVDLGGGWVVPPLADAHSHSLADPNFEKESDRFLSQGIFYVANPNSLATWTRQARELAASPETVDVTYALGGITSPGGHPTQIYDRFARHSPDFEPADMDGEAYFAVGSMTDLDRAWPRLLKAAPDFVKVYLEHSEDHERRSRDAAFTGQRGLDPSLLPEVVARAHDAGLRVAAHVASAADFLTAVAAGVDVVAHLPLEPLSAEDAKAARVAGTVVVTTVLSHRPVDDPARLPAIHSANLALLADAGVEIVVGTDSDRGLLAELLAVEELTGWPRSELLGLATTDTARWIFPDRRIGSLDPGFEASFLVLDEDPLDDLSRLGEIKLRVKSGHLLEVGEDAGDRPGIANALAHALMRDGADAAIAEYQRLRAESPDAYDFSEPQLNALGYFALEQDRPSDAVAIFRLNASQFPESANVWDSLGDGLVAAGELREAIEAYQKALEIAPDNESTRTKLRETESRAAGAGG